QAKIPDVKQFAELMQMIKKDEISSRGAKDLLLALVVQGGDVRSIATDKGLFQKSDKSDLEKIVAVVIEKNPDVVSEYKKGNEKVLQFLLGQAMKESRGSANPQVLKEVFVEKLAE